MVQQSQSGSIYIREYRVRGATRLPKEEIEEAVYPFLGPGRTPVDVEDARAALEKAYKDKGYQTVVVQVPPQSGAGGVIFLQVVENRVGRLRVRGSRYFSPTQIKKEAPSLEEGTVPNFNAVSRDIVALNQLPDRRVTPSLRTGVAPGTVDIDLEVQDKFPLHGSLELNNRYSPDTTELRLNGAVSYNNLWQLGHSIGFSFQLAPERLDRCGGVFRLLSRPNTGRQLAEPSGRRAQVRIATSPLSVARRSPAVATSSAAEQLSRSLPGRISITALVLGSIISILIRT